MVKIPNGNFVINNVHLEHQSEVFDLIHALRIPMKWARFLLDNTLQVTQSCFEGGDVMLTFYCRADGYFFQHHIYQKTTDDVTSMEWQRTSYAGGTFLYKLHAPTDNEQSE